MAAEAKPPSSWVYPDRRAWEEFLDLRPRPRPVLEKPPWWRGAWPARWPGKPAAAALSNDRKFEAIRNELAWAQKCFYYAQSVLPTSQAKEKAGRLGDALGRTRGAIDEPARAQVIAQAVDELAGIGKYDPAKYPQAFIEAAGRSLSAAGAVLETSPFESVAYWGRYLVRAGGFFRVMKHELPEGR